MMNRKTRSAKRQFTLADVLGMDFGGVFMDEGVANRACGEQATQVRSMAPLVETSKVPQSDQAAFADGTITLPADLAPPYLSFNTAADWLGISVATLERIIEDGFFEPVPIGKRPKIPLAQLRNYVIARLASKGRRSPRRIKADQVRNDLFKNTA